MELRSARWSQVNFARYEFRAVKSKTLGGDDRVIPLDQVAMDAFIAWRAR